MNPRLSILIPSILSRRFVFNNLFQEFNRQIDMNGLRGKGWEYVDKEVPDIDENGNPVLSEHGTPIVIVTTERIKHPDTVELLFNLDDIKSIGEKRNTLLQKATGDYVCFFDDDDWPSEDYIISILKALESDPDCCSLRGEITIDGKPPEVFEHSLKYRTWRTVNGKVRYERYPNHLNAIKSDIAKAFRFPEKNFGEDHDWSTLVHRSGLLKTEAYIDKTLYYYRYISNKAIA